MNVKKLVVPLLFIILMPLFACNNKTEDTSQETDEEPTTPFVIIPESVDLLYDFNDAGSIIWNDDFLTINEQFVYGAIIQNDEELSIFDNTGYKKYLDLIISFSYNFFEQYNLLFTGAFGMKSIYDTFIFDKYNYRETRLEILYNCNHDTNIRIDRCVISGILVMKKESIVTELETRVFYSSGETLFRKTTFR